MNFNLSESEPAPPMTPERELPQVAVAEVKTFWSYKDDVYDFNQWHKFVNDAGVFNWDKQDYTGPDKITYKFIIQVCLCSYPI